MTILDAVIQGIVQGLTEFLPVSSDGHLTLVQYFTGTNGQGSLLFTVMLHLGTLISVFVFYRHLIGELIIEFFRMCGQIFTGKFHYKACNSQQKMIIMILVSLIPLLAFYFVKDYFAALAEDNDIIVEGICFLFTGSLLMLADKCPKDDKVASEMKVKDSLIIGFFQGVAALPGVSRSGSTISVALLRGFSREYAVAFSFIMGIPAIIGANVFEVKDAIPAETQMEFLPILIGIVLAAAVGFFAIKLIAWLVKTDKFAVFAYYTLVLGALVICEGIFEIFAGKNIFQYVGGLIK